MSVDLLPRTMAVRYPPTTRNYNTFGPHHYVDNESGIQFLRLEWGTHDDQELVNSMRQNYELPDRHVLFDFRIPRKAHRQKQAPKQLLDRDRVLLRSVAGPARGACFTGRVVSVWQDPVQSKAVGRCMIVRESL